MSDLTDGEARSMPMSEGQIKSLALVAEKLREQEAPFRERGDPRGLGIGAAALVVEMAVDEIAHLRALLAAYVADEDRFNSGRGKPYGSISTEIGMRARAAISTG